MVKKRLLIADDSPLQHEIYAEQFGDEYDLRHAYDGAETLIMAVELKPDLILLDIMMPLLDGRSICKKLKTHPTTEQIKIILVSAKDTQSDRLVGFEVGADDYIEKTASIDLLVRSVHNLLRPD